MNEEDLPPEFAFMKEIAHIAKGHDQRLVAIGLSKMLCGYLAAFDEPEKAFETHAKESRDYFVKILSFYKENKTKIWDGLC